MVEQGDFNLTEIFRDNLPERISGWSAAACSGPWAYKPPAGYFVHSCRMEKEIGSHGAGADCLVCFVTVVKIPEGGTIDGPVH